MMQTLSPARYAACLFASVTLVAAALPRMSRAAPEVAPTITNVNPNVEVAGAAAVFLVEGTNFDAATQVRLGQSTYSSASGLTVSAFTSTMLQVAFPATITLAGAYTLWVANSPYDSGNRAATMFTVMPNSLDHINVTPVSASLLVSETQAFTAAGFDVYNNPIGGLTLDWSALAGGSIVSSGASTATFHAGTIAGVYTNAVRAESGSRHGFATITVQPGPLAGLTVSPTVATLTPGAMLQFTALGRDTYGNAVPTSSVDWSVDGGAGTINGSGLFTAGGLGNYPDAVRAALNSISATASVNILPQAVDRVEITPNTLINMPLRGTKLVTATAYDSSNGVINGISVDWSVGPLEQPGVEILASGAMTALLRAGTTQALASITASTGAKSATVPVSVRPATLAVSAAPEPLVTDGRAAATVTVSATTSAGAVGPGVPVSLEVGTSGGACTVAPQQGATSGSGTFTSTLRCVHTSATGDLSSTIAITASLPTQSAGVFASTTLAGRFKPARVWLPASMKWYPLVTGNHTACTAYPLNPNRSASQLMDNPFNIYSFVAPAGTLSVSVRDYASSGRLLLYLIAESTCPASMRLTFLSQTTLTPSAFNIRYQGLTPGAGYLLMVNTTGTLLQQPYSIRLEP
jgi:hypothetical protein